MIVAGGIVLCGGMSSRMGTSKAMLPFGPEAMELPAHIMVTRGDSDERGPLEGLCAGWKAMPAGIELAYVTSCKGPAAETGSAWLSST